MYAIWVKAEFGKAKKAMTKDEYPSLNLSKSKKNACTKNTSKYALFQCRPPPLKPTEAGNTGTCRKYGIGKIAQKGENTVNTILCYVWQTVAKTPTGKRA